MNYYSYNALYFWITSEGVTGSLFEQFVHTLIIPSCQHLHLAFREFLYNNQGDIYNYFQQSERLSNLFFGKWTVCFCVFFPQSKDHTQTSTHPGILKAPQVFIRTAGLKFIKFVNRNKVGQMYLYKAENLQGANI